MDEFVKICLCTEAKIKIFIKKNKLEGTVNLQKVVEYCGEHCWFYEDYFKTSASSKIKEEIDIEVNEVKPNISRFVMGCDIIL